MCGYPVESGGGVCWSTETTCLRASVAYEAALAAVVAVAVDGDSGIVAVALLLLASHPSSERETMAISNNCGVNNERRSR